MKSHSTIDEKELLRRLQDGDQTAFDFFYRKYSPMIYGRLIRLTALKEIALELLQDTFVTLWEKRHTINTDLSFKAWLYKVAENMVYQYYRKVSRDHNLQQMIMAEFSEFYFHVEENLEHKENLKQLHDILDQLSPQRRRVFELCKIEGRSYEEAAKILGISPSTVSNHLVKANLFIKQHIFGSKELTLLVISFYFLNR